MASPIQRYHTDGVGNIDHKAEFAVTISLCAVRVHFVRESGSGTDIADMYLDLDAVDSRNGNNNRWNHRLWTWFDAGVYYDVRLFIEDDLSPAWTFWPGDKLWFRWTNPDSAEIGWGLHILYREA